MARQMKDSGIEWIKQIPNHWNITRGKNILQLMKRSPEQNDEVVTCFRDGEVTLRKNRREKGFTFSDKEIGYQGIKKGDIVIHGMDGFAGAIGISDSDGKGSPVLVVCTTKENARYIVYYLRVLADQGVFVALATGIRERSCDLRWNKISDLLFPVPEINEQCRVASYLDRKCAEIDAIIAKQQQIIEKLKEYKLSVITEAVTKGLDPNVPMKDSGVEWIGKVPKKWKIVPLKVCIDILPGYAFSSNDFDSENGIPLLRGINVTPNGIRWEDVVYWSQPVTKLLENFELSAGDIVVGLDRPWVSEGTRICWVTEKDLPALLLQRVCRIRAKDNIDSRWVYHWIASKSFQEALSIETTGVSVPHISTKQIGQFSITLPPIEMQCQICDILETKCRAIDQTISEKQKIIANFLGYKKSLMYEVVTGKREG